MLIYVLNYTKIIIHEIVLHTSLNYFKKFEELALNKNYFLVYNEFKKKC